MGSAPRIAGFSTFHHVPHLLLCIYKVLSKFLWFLDHPYLKSMFFCFVFFPLATLRIPFALNAVHDTKLRMGNWVILVLLFSITPHPQCLPARVTSGPMASVGARSLLILKFPTSSKNRFHTGALKNNILRITDGNEARGERGSK